MIQQKNIQLHSMGRKPVPIATPEEQQAVQTCKLKIMSAGMRQWKIVTHQRVKV